MIKIFYGPAIEFEKTIPKNTERVTLTKLLSELDSKNRELKIVQEGDNNNRSSIKNIENLVITTEEYARLSESGINGFLTLLSEVDITNMYIQNPPEAIFEQLKKCYEKDIKRQEFKHKKINENHLNYFYKGFSDIILGQDGARDKLMINLYKIAKGYNKEKPLVLMLYGPSGVGKTETAKYLSKTIGVKLFRKQFSMYQNMAFADYVFGSNHNSSSLARDLLDRDSNIILFDEFDKPSSIFYSAFYQMFDEGKFVDKNYKVNLKNSIIICTSNFLNLNDIKKSLGDAIFSRFDSFIEYEELSDEVVKEMIKIKFNSIYKFLSNEDKKFINFDNDVVKILTYSKKLKNVRDIDRVINEYVFSKIINEKFEI